MSKKEVLERAIAKAVDKGFGWLHGYEVRSRYGYLNDKKKTVEEPYILQKRGIVYERELAYQVVIFNQDFAKALWGEELYEWADTQSNRFAVKGGYLDGPVITWQYHLQMMVVADDPIKYLGEHL